MVSYIKYKMRLLLLVPVFLLFPGSLTCMKPFNDYLDTVLNTALQVEIRALKLNPLALPDFKVEFEDRIKIIGKVHGSAEYTNGLLYGFDSVKRLDDCTSLLYGYSTPYTNCSIVLENLNIVFSGKLKYGKLPSVRITARANMSSTVLGVGVFSYLPNVNQLRYFTFLKIGRVETKFTGLGAPLNKYMGILKNDFLEHAWPAFFNSIGQPFQIALGRAIESVPFVWY